MPTGSVKWFDSSKGFGFIAPDDGGTDIFVHISAVEKAGLDDLIPNQRLSYDIEKGSKSGKPQAVRLDPQ